MNERGTVGSPMPEPGRRERKKQATRQHIAMTAVRLFLERGFDDVSVAEIAEAADVSKVTVFNYFPSKTDMVFELAETRRPGRCRPRPGARRNAAGRDPALLLRRAGAPGGVDLPARRGGSVCADPVGQPDAAGGRRRGGSERPSTRSRSSWRGPSARRRGRADPFSDMDRVAAARGDRASAGGAMINARDRAADQRQRRPDARRA